MEGFEEIGGNMPDHSQYVTIWWLLGSTLAVLGIILPIVFGLSKNLPTKEVCNERHKNIDTNIVEIKKAAEHNKEKLEEVSMALIRIETILNNNFREKK